MDRLQAWINEQGWELLAKQQVTGGYTGVLYRLRLRDERGGLVRAVYKQFAPGRDGELPFYERVVPLLPHGVPQLYGIVPGEGILIEEAGTALKPLFQNGSPAAKRELLERVVTLLADLHVSLAGPSAEWEQAGIVSSYPFHSSVEFAQDAFRELQEQVGRLPGVDDRLLAELREMEAFFYPRYPQYVGGQQTFTHGDPHMENILLDGGQIRLIDWEYASLAVPQRDLSILLQDVPEDSLHALALTVFRRELAKRGWAVTPDFDRAFTACMFDNTLMMLGFELWKYRNGHLSGAEIEQILPRKVGWMRRAYHELKKEC
ncbi:phosphotransferase family enzyme [Tumebacillus sp. BK434]|uniref:phosphotransferase family protein n=1 Tax=Tumebacillus sp. BK434 TaxID=2512169 RepID=UPI00104F9E54|nr:aminoglycoside phosphotransferase family protein [Tumebacillus sp. BK434]TCP53941.1 phosphotransferase family enzyme [Tumebacillus sp. BK434]